MFFFNYNNTEKFAKGGKLSSKYNYIRNADIESVEVNKKGKTIEIDGADIIDGLYVKKGKYANGGGVGNPKVSFLKYWGKDGTVYDQTIKIDKETFKMIDEKVLIEILSGYPRKDEYVYTSGYEIYLKKLIPNHKGIVEMNHTQTRFVNLFLKLPLKDRNTILRIVDMYANGGGVQINDSNSLRYFLLNHASSGMIANKIPYSDYKTIDAIRFTALQIINRDGDREYSVKSFSDLIQEALLEYEENKYDGKFAKGGGVDDYTKNFGLVKVKFENPVYNYETSVNGDITESEARKYFVGKMFDRGTYPKENMQRAIDIEFYPKGTYANGGGVVENWEGEYLTITADKNKMVIKLTNEGVEQIKEMIHENKSNLDILQELFEDISANSELIFHYDLGVSGFGLTSASGVTDGYRYDDNGNLESVDNSAKVYYFNDYAIRSEIDDLLAGELILFKAN